MGRGSHTCGGSVQNGGKEVASSWSDSKPGKHTGVRNRRRGGGPERRLAIHNQGGFARLHVGSQKEPEPGGQILPESQPAAEPQDSRSFAR